MNEQLSCGEQWFWKSIGTKWWHFDTDIKSHAEPCYYVLPVVQYTVFTQSASTWSGLSGVVTQHGSCGLAATSTMVGGAADATAMEVVTATAEGTARLSGPIETELSAVGGKQCMSALCIGGNWCCPLAGNCGVCMAIAWEVA